MATTLIHSTGLKGLYRQVGLGVITNGYPHNPKALFLYRSVSFDSSEKAIYGDDARCIEAPIGQLVSLPVGTLLKDDLAVSSPDFEVVTVSISFGHGTVRRATRDELEAEGRLQQMSRNAAIAESRIGEANWYVCACTNAQFDKILIPATAVYAAFYAPTSRLASRILAGDIRDLDLNFVYRNKSKPIDSNGHAVIALRPGVLKAEALPIARAHFDSSFRAHLEQIHIQSSIQLRGNQPIFLRCEPPAKGHVRLRVQGMRSRLKGATVPDLVVLRIISSDEPLPFKTLEVHLDQSTANAVSGNNGDANEPGLGGNAKPPDDFLVEFLTLAGSTALPGPANSLVVSLGVPATEFLAMGPGDFTIVRRKSKRNRKGLGHTPPIPTSSNSLGRGNSQGDASLQQTDLTAPTQAQDVDGDDGVAPIERSPRDAFQSILDAVTILQTELGLGLSARLVSKNGMCFQGFPVNQVNTEITGRPDKWVYISSAPKVARQILLLELSRSQSFVYLLEIVRGSNEEFSTLTFCKKDRVRMGDDELKAVLDMVDEFQRIPPNLQLKALIGHRGPDESAESAAVRADARRVKHSYGDPAALAERLAVLLPGD